GLWLWRGVLRIVRRQVACSWRGTIVRARRIGGSGGRGQARCGRLRFVSALCVCIRIILRGSVFEDAPRIIGNILDPGSIVRVGRSEEHTSELQSRFDLVCRLLLEKKNKDM